MNNEAQLRSFEQELHLWKRKLKLTPDIANSEALEVIKRIAPRHHYTELNKYYSQLMAGAACPQDFVRDRRPS